MTAIGADERLAILERRRTTKMARSAHAFVRGNTLQHYAWMRELPPLPDGPPVWICGDCHVGNLGPIADKKGKVDVQIRDLDQCTIGNPAHDIVRLALSLASAARGSDLPGATTARIVESMIEGYGAGLAALDEENPVAEPNTVTAVRRRALGRKWQHLANERLGDVRPEIPLGRKFWELSAEEKRALGELLDAPAVKSLILSLNKRGEDSRVEMIDAAYWMKGCSSLGKLRYAALVHIAGDRREKISLVDVKEAVPAAAPTASGVVAPADHAERVVKGALACSPNLGQRMAAGTISHRPVIVRELMPEDLKLEMEQFSRREAVTAARYLASVVGKAHGRQMSEGDRRRWRAELERYQPSDLAAPTWLWTTVLQLLVRHEEAYLEHCRIHGEAA